MANIKGEKNPLLFCWKILHVVTENNCYCFFCIFIFNSGNRVKCHHLVKYTFIQAFGDKAKSMLILCKANFGGSWMTTLFTICSANCVAN